LRTSEEGNNVNELSEALSTLADRAREARLETDRIRMGLGSAESVVVAFEIANINRQILEQEERLTVERGRSGRATRSRLEALIEERDRLQEILDAEERRVEMERRLQEERDISEQISRRNQSVSDTTQELENQIRLSETILRYGEDSVEVERERNRQARAAFVTEQLRAGATAEQIIQMLELVRQAQELEGEVEDARVAAEDTADAVDSIDFTSSIEGARELARSLGVSLSTARLIAGIGGPGVGGEALDPRSPRYNPAAAAQAQRDAQLAAIRESFETSGRTSRTGGGGGGGTPEFASRVFGPELQEAIERAQEDLRLYNQEVQMLDSALRAGLITQQEYNSFVAQAQEVYNQAQQSAYDYEKALEQVEKTTMSSMENAFMSIIDGSKSASEAFKDMARQILAEAMRMMVIRPLIQGLFGGGGFLGGIFGGVTGTKASGGTMMAGEPYLVGERGPEIVMPSRSGTVMNADLTRKAMGGSDGVVVNQTINVNGGNDPAAIRQEVAKLMPQITNATKTAVIDARRRGGQMRAAFQ